MNGQFSSGIRREQEQQQQQQREEDSPFLGWCIGGALSPDYYQLLLGECTPDSLESSSSSSSSAAMTKMRHEDQLWNMDDRGYVHSIFDYGRCMMVPSSSMMISGGLANEIAVEIGPCDDADALNRFRYYDDDDDDDSSTTLATMNNTLRPIGHDDYCVTFLGGGGGDMAAVSNNGAPMILAPCYSAAAAVEGK
eukprot:CAMPEP_0181127402 /NCGR_PEP_ID=MMETSP1071-20121207/28181_1 /TAXON_ID=35127 /ORGANISM="Thalassiosira sp., Strain NH16" /LENGTH=193 /DNA_ID=CAMNT_0023213143 /DNA_START=31 /DNA_END=609 /DNA_ORIENTATION=-